MNITITINTDNAAFSDWPEDEVASILDKLSYKLREDGADAVDDLPLKDYNGNTVGKVTLSDDWDLPGRNGRA